MLLLKKHLVALVRAGKKRQTIRLWSRPIVFAGQISYTPGLGRLRIVSVEELPGFDALTEADAVADGFTDRAALLAELHRNYPIIPPGKRLFRVVFQWPLRVTGKPAPRGASPGPVAPARCHQRTSPGRGSGPTDAGAARVQSDTAGLLCQRRLLRDYVLARRPGSIGRT